jgi:hypothetical protein
VRYVQHRRSYLYDIAPARPYEEPSDEDQPYAPNHKEGEVIDSIVRNLSYIMDAEQLMVNDAFHEVEPAPAEDEASNKLAQKGNPLPMICRAPEEQDPRECHQPDPRMKQPIPDHIHVHGFEGGWGHPIGEHMVPLQDLVQDNPINKASQANAKYNSCVLRFPVRDVCRHRDVLTLGGHGRC